MGTQDLAGIVSRFRRHIPISLAIIVAAVALAVVLTSLMPKKYSATVQLSYAPQAPLAHDAQPAAPVPITDAQRDAAIDAQLQTVTSLPVANQVLQTTNLAKDPAILKLAKRFDPTDTTPSSDAFAAALLSNVSAARISSTPLFGITYTDKDPVNAARIANAVADSFLSIQAQQKLGLNAGSMTGLQKQVADLRKQAQSADAAVSAYRLQHNLLVDPNAPNASLSNPLTQMDAQLSDARGQAAQAQVRGTASNSTVVASGVDTTALSSLQQQRAQASSALAGLEAHYGDRNPQVIAARQQVTDLDAAISKEMAAMSRSAHAESSAAIARASSIAASKANTENQLASGVRDSVVLADLQRKADDAHAIYSNLLATMGQQNANAALVQPDAQKVTPAVPPLEASSPKPLINLLLGFALGLAISVGLAYLRERWSQTINTNDDIHRLLGIDYLSSIPTLQSAIDKPKTRDPAEAVILHPLSSYAESFRSLGQALIFDARKAETSGGRVIGVGSALPREGKTTTAISLARVLAMGATKVVLVDVDLRRRSVTQTLAPATKKGWLEVLQGSATFDEVLAQDQTGAMILPIAQGSEKAQRVFEDGGFDKMIAHLRQNFEVIIIDTAPVLALVDTRSIMPHLDSFALLAHWRTTPVKAIRAALHQLDSVGASVLGVVMTMVNLKTQAQSGYGDASYYYDEMKEYYSN